MGGALPPPPSVDPPPDCPPPAGPPPDWPPPGQRFCTVCAAVDAVSLTVCAAVDAVPFIVSTTRLITLGLLTGAVTFGAAFFGAAFFGAAFFAAFFGAGFLAALFGAAFLATRRAGERLLLFFPAVFRAGRAEDFLALFFAFFDDFFDLEDLPEDFFLEEDFLEAAMQFLLLRTCRAGLRGSCVARRAM